MFRRSYIHKQHDSWLEHVLSARMALAGFVYAKDMGVRHHLPFGGDFCILAHINAAHIIREWCVLDSDRHGPLISKRRHIFSHESLHCDIRECGPIPHTCASSVPVCNQVNHFHSHSRAYCSNQYRTACPTLCSTSRRSGPRQTACYRAGGGCRCLRRPRAPQL